MLKRKVAVWLFAPVSFLLFGNAVAAVIDFRAADWSGMSHQKSFTQDGLTLEAYAQSAEYELMQSEMGIGINSFYVGPGDDPNCLVRDDPGLISVCQSLTISFSEQWADRILTGFWLSDMSHGEGEGVIYYGDGEEGEWYPDEVAFSLWTEQGRLYDQRSGSWGVPNQTIYVDLTQYRELSENPSAPVELSFYFPGMWNCVTECEDAVSFADFSLRGLSYEVNEVMEPLPALLAAFPLLLLGLRRRLK